MLAVVIVWAAFCLDRLGPRDEPIATNGTKPDVCFALSVIHSTVLRDRVPAPFATPEQAAAVSEINADLSQMRRSLYELDGIRQLGCQQGG